MARQGSAKARTAVRIRSKPHLLPLYLLKRLFYITAAFLAFLLMSATIPLLSFLEDQLWWHWQWFSPAVLQEFSWESRQILYLIPFVPLLLVLRWLLAIPLHQKLDIALPARALRFQWLSLLRFVPDILMSLFLILLLMSLARPQKVNQLIKKYTEGIDLVLALDVSESMLIEDFTPNRLVVAKEVAQKFVSGRFQDRIGLVVFSGDAFSLCPLTTDYRLLQDFIGQVEFGIIQKGGTAIGSALAVCTNRLRESEAKTKVIILLSDGDNTAGNLEPNTAAELAKYYGIKIYSILVGQEGQVPYGRDAFGNVRYISNSIDESALRGIASIGNGLFFRANDEQALESIFKRISEYEKSEIIESSSTQAKDYYRIYLIWAMICFLLWLLLKSTFMNNFLED